MPAGEGFCITKHGIRLTGMPAWGSLLSDDQIWKLTAFLAHMDSLPPSVEQEWKKQGLRTQPSRGRVKMAA
jgi:mono/diheme cytochrome c family protein